MSQRSLFEINHDCYSEIKRYPEAFTEHLQRFLSSGDKESAQALEFFGFRFFGRRHHSDGFVIEWGGNRHMENRS